MSLRISPTLDPNISPPPDPAGAGLGALHTARGNLPLERLGLNTRITGLIGHTELEQAFHNPYDEPLEATYVFPLPDRAAVTGMRMTADDRVIEATLAERGDARAAYQQAVAAGRRAAIAEEERPDVFTMRVGNIVPGERVTVTLTLAGPLSYEDGEATLRFPLVVAPRYIPGAPLPGERAGAGHAADTDTTPDASRITPPVLLPGFPNPVRLGIDITLDTGGLPLAAARCSLPVTEVADGRWRVEPGQRADRDLVLRLRYGHPVQTSHTLTLCPDTEGTEGTYQLTVLPPTGAALPRPRDVVLVLDRSGSMQGWKMAAARRAAARIVDTLTGADRFAVLTFDNVVERPSTLPAGLVAGTDRHRFQAVEHLAALAARGGTELLTPLREALSLLGGTGDGEGRDRVLVLVTDGQVGNEDHILHETAAALATVRLHAIGIDKAVNAGFLGRLAAAGGGRCELVESEDRLDDAAGRIHERIGAPLVTGLAATSDGLPVLAGTAAPDRQDALFTGVPLVLTGRYQGAPAGALVVRGTDQDGAPWTARVEASVVDNPALPAMWARAHLRDLEDRYAAASRHELAELERRIVATSLRFSVLCRFTAYVAADTRTVTDGSEPHRVIQPVEPAAGWDMLAPPSPFAPVPMAPGQVGAPGLPMLEQPVFGQPMAATMDTAIPESTSARPPSGPAAGGVLGARPAGRGRALGRSRVPAAKPAGQPADLATGLAPVFATEAARLRAAAGAPERERRLLLADLASRLDVLVGSPHPEPAGEGPLAQLYRLLTEVRGDAVRQLPAGRLAELWRRMQDLLDALAASAPPPPAPAPPTAERRRGFWKRT